MPVAPEHELPSSEELLHRQVHPTFLRDGRLSSQAFKPNSGDDGQLSVARGSLASAKAAYERYIARKRASCGVWSVTLTECAAVSAPAYADPLEDDDAHAVINFNEVATKSQWDKVADKLAACARARGCQHAA